MKHTYADRGFGTAGTVIIILVIAVIGLSAYFVWSRGLVTKSGTQSQTNTDSTPAQTPKDDRGTVLPADYVRYTHKDTALTFAYPKAWGDVTAELAPEDAHLIKGHQWLFSFSNNAKVTVGTNSTDATHNPAKGHDGSGLDVNAYVSSPGSITAGDTTKIYTKNDTYTVAGRTFAGIGCGGVGELMVVNRNDKTYPSVAFMSLEKTFDSNGYNKETGAVPEDVCDAAIYQKYLSAETAKVFETIAPTVR